MASTNTPPVMWSVGNTVGQNVAGATTPLYQPPFTVSTATTVPTVASDVGAFYLADTNLYAYNGSTWIGKYSTSA